MYSVSPNSGFQHKELDIVGKVAECCFALLTEYSRRLGIRVVETGHHQSFQTVCCFGMECLVAKSGYRLLVHHMEFKFSSEVSCGGIRPTQARKLMSR